ncbi:MAG: hypothetical protein O4965_19025 [Trichodesmium sp. St19_bin1]|nr:hypothetical protein [Trichodesmium sp. St19_bin1]
MLALPSNAAIISYLFPTGVDSSGAPLGDGVSDPNYYILETESSGVVMNENNIPASWVSHSSNSNWIWEKATGKPTHVTRTFRTTFDLTGLDPNTASISGKWAVDNQGLDILVNGISTGQTNFGFEELTTFNINSGFVDGLNTLDFVAKDLGHISGFLVDSISGNADAIPQSAPEGSSLLSLLVVGLFSTASLVMHHFRD